MNQKELVKQLLARVDMLEEIVYGGVRDINPEANMVKKSAGIEIREDQYLFIDSTGTFNVRVRCSDGTTKVSMGTKNDQVARHIRNEVIINFGDKPARYPKHEFRESAKATIKSFWSRRQDTF